MQRFLPIFLCVLLLTLFPAGPAEAHDKAPPMVLPKTLTQGKSAPAQASLQDQSYVARAAYEANPNDVIAATNFAILQLQIGDRELAQSIFSAAVKLHPDDYIASLGLAQALANDPEQGAASALKQLEKVEKLPPAPGKDAYSRLLLTADCYTALNAFPRAFNLYKQALLLNKGDRGLLEKCARAALSCAEIEQAKNYLPQLEEKEVSDQQLLLLLARHIRGLAPGHAKTLSDFIMQSANRNFANDAEFYYQLGRALQASNDGAAGDCLKKAVALAPDEGKFVLAHAVALLGAHQEKEALIALKAMAAKSAAQEPSPRRTLVAGLVKAGVAMLEQPGRKYQSSVVQITSLSCLCKVAAINFILRSQPGVVFAQVPEGKGPQNLIVYAPEQTTATVVWGKMAKEAKYKILPALSKTLSDFPSLYALASGNYETPTIAQKPHYNFESLPLRHL